jgi:hypothetical protein
LQIQIQVGDCISFCNRYHKDTNTPPRTLSIYTRDSVCQRILEDNLRSSESEPISNWLRDLDSPQLSFSPSLETGLAPSLATHSHYMVSRIFACWRIARPRLSAVALPALRSSALLAYHPLRLFESKAQYATYLERGTYHVLVPAACWRWAYVCAAALWYFLAPTRSLQLPFGRLLRDLDSNQDTLLQRQ